MYIEVIKGERQPLLNNASAYNTSPMENKRKAPVWQWILGIVAVLCIGGIGAYFFLRKDLSKPSQQSVIKPILSDELKKMIIKASDSLYRLEFSYFDINIDSGKGLIKDLKLIPDSSIYQKLLLAKKAPNIVMTMSTDSAAITHFALEKTPDGRKLVVDDIIIQNPNMTVDYKLQSYNDSDNVKEEKSVLKTMTDLLRFASIQHVSLRNLNFAMINHNGSTPRKTALRNLDINIAGINTSTTTLNDSSGKKYTALTIFSNRLATPDGLYYLTMEDIRYAPEVQTLTVKKTMLEPRLNKEDFYKKVKLRKDRYHFIHGNTIYKGIDIDKLLSRQQIHIQSMSTASSWGEVYTDYNYPKRKVPVRRHGDPHERLQRLAFDITIDTMNMHNGTFLYSIKGEKSEDVATFKLDNMEGQYVNITNNAIAKAANHYATVHSTARVMEGAYITNNMLFNLNDKDGAFTITSVMGSMDGKLMNPLMKPLALLEVQSLDIEKMKTVIHGNAYRGKGNIDLYYKNMKVAFVKKEEEDKYKKQKLLSFVSNLFVPDDNPKKNGKFKKGPIDIKRGDYDSFFGFLWKCMLEGMAAHMTGLKKE